MKLERKQPWRTEEELSAEPEKGLKIRKMPEKASQKTIIAVCFLATGVTGLVYEIVWTRMLILVFGSTLFATTTILTTFMAGFALGSILFGRIIDRYARPLMVYGTIAVSLGLTAR